MEKQIILTGDGSHTIAIPQMNATYHSTHGAVQESRHIFIEAGLQYLLNYLPDQRLNIFEMGFGTGLNALLTATKAAEKEVNIQYTTIETAPLSIEEAANLNYGEALLQPLLFKELHACRWNEEVALNKYFSIKKVQGDLITYTTAQRFHLIYYDAFAPSAQPELWTREVFDKLFIMLAPEGVLVTYCSKGDVRRAMSAAGFSVKKIPGPPGKREMVRATHRPLPAIL